LQHPEILCSGNHLRARIGEDWFACQKSGIFFSHLLREIFAAIAKGSSGHFGGAPSKSLVAHLSYFIEARS
jgi:hypothetical protein